MKQTSQTLRRRVTKIITGRYLLSLPAGYAEQPKKKWPLVLFLHGAGERGNNLELVKKHGPPKLVESGRQFPFILVSPQCPAGDFWRMEVLDGLLEEIEAKHRVDRKRIYVTGLSMGGFGTWALSLVYPQRFAAIAPICGGGSPFLADRIKHLPVWVFHGEKDSVVPLARSAEMVAALRHCGGNVKFTAYPKANHDSWTVTYDNPELYRWLLRHKQKS